MKTAKKNGNRTSVHRIALIWGGGAMSDHRSLSSLVHRASAEPNIVIKRFIVPVSKASLISKLCEWKPDAIISKMGDVETMKCVRHSFPDCPLVSIAVLPPNLANVTVNASGTDVMEVAVRYYETQGLESFALFTVGHDAARKIQKTLFNERFKQREGKTFIFDKELCLETLMSEPTDRYVRSVGAWLKTLPSPTGILTTDNHAAVWLLRLCIKMGVRVPGDIQIIGVDGVDESMEYVPHLSTIQLPYERIGTLALETVVKLLDDKRCSLPPVLRVNGATLVLRGTTGVKSIILSNIPAALSYFESQYARGITVEEAIKHTQHVSVVTFYKDFMAATGCSPAAYLHRLKMDTATCMLRDTQLTVTNIAELSGFGSGNYFTQVFRKEMGVTPTAYRRQNKAAKG